MPDLRRSRRREREWREREWREREDKQVSANPSSPGLGLGLGRVG